MTAGLDQLDHLLDMPLESYLDASANRHEDEITELNKRQLDRGLDANGQDLGRYSSIKYKGRFRPVDLLDTGAFRGSFQVDPVTGGFVVNATDSKLEKLTEKYGEDITGVPEQDLGTVGMWLADDLVQDIRERL